MSEDKMTNRKVPFDYASSKFNEMFRVMDISNPIVTAGDQEEAKQIHETQGFDVVPIKDHGGNIKEYYNFKSDGVEEIKPDDLISESCGIIETFNYLSTRHFFFVLTGKNITHIVHYSDLNNPMVLIGLYTHLAYGETAIREFAKRNNKYGNTESGMKKFLEAVNANLSGVKIDVERAKKQFDSKKKEQTETNILDELYFDEELILFREQLGSILDEDELVEFQKSVNLDDATIGSYKELRNDIMHPKPQTIKRHSDIQKWIGLLQACQEIIKVIDRGVPE